MASSSPPLELAAPPSLRRLRAPRAPRWLAGAALPAAALALWELLARAGAVPPNWLPAPTALLRTAGDLLARGELAGHLGTTLLRVAAGYLVGAAAATALGVLTGLHARTREMLDPTLQALRAIPSMAWAPLFLLWLGIGETAKVALIAVGAFFPVYLALACAIAAVDPRLVEVGLVYRLRGLALVRRIVLPAVLPQWIVGLRGGLGLAWMFVVAAELVGASRGLGFLMVDGQTTSRPELILVSLVLFAALGKASDAGLQALARRVLPWGNGR
jgi:sulfonate transport system permease protein